MDDLLIRLCEAAGVSGSENEVREIIKEEAAKYADEVRVDNIGNVIAFKKGKNASRHVMLAAHMDEVGLIVSRIDDSGYIHFHSIGGIDPRVLLGKRVLVGKDKIPGVLGVKAIHLQSPQERTTVIPMSSLYIDVGAESKEQTGVKLGDAISFATQCEPFGDGRVKAKALDDRVGCYILLKLMQNTYKDDISFCFTVQEEVGTRGAYVAAYTVAPDLAIVCEGTTSADVPGVEETQKVTKFGGGPAVSFMDAASIGNRELVLALLDTAKASGVPHQVKMSASGGNDAGAINTSLDGIPTAVVSVPVRYIHSPVSVADLGDIENTEKLIDAYLKKE